MCLLLAGCNGEAAQNPPTDSAKKEVYTVRFTLLDYLHFSQNVSEGRIPAQLEIPEGLTVSHWTDKNGNVVDPFATAVTGDVEYVGVAYPALTNHVPYLFTDSNGLIQPQLPLTGEALQQALSALAAPSAKRYFPGMPGVDVCVTGKQVYDVLQHFFPAEEVGVFFPKDSDASVSRNAFAVGMHKLLKRDATELLQVSDDVAVPGDIILDSDDAICLLEAAVVHTPSENGHSWLDLDLPSSFEPGFVNIHGSLYYVQENGKFLRNEKIGNLQFGADGRYTSGDADLDALVAQILDKIITDAPEAKRLDHLRSAFNYCRDSFTYRRREAYAFGQTGWETADAKTMFETTKGNCYNFAAAFWALARGLGYEAYGLAGTCTKSDQPHGWVQIEFDGEDFFFDPEWHWDYINDKREVKDMFKISLEDADWWYYKWVPVKKGA
jgi:hypothetical protein